jgi:hypothetical protein
VRSALAEVPGISDIKTDVPGRSATFKLAAADPEFDLKAKLDELEAGNEHMKGWKFAAAQK